MNKRMNKMVKLFKKMKTLASSFKQRQRLDDSKKLLHSSTASHEFAELVAMIALNERERQSKTYNSCYQLIRY
jgi:hypothetical protein